MVASSHSPMTDKVCDILISLNIYPSTYNSVLFDIDDVCTYLNDLFISLSSDLVKTRKSCIILRIGLKRKILR